MLELVKKMQMKIETIFDKKPQLDIKGAAQIWRSNEHKHLCNSAESSIVEKGNERTMGKVEVQRRI